MLLNLFQAAVLKLIVFIPFGGRGFPVLGHQAAKLHSRKLYAYGFEDRGFLVVYPRETSMHLRPTLYIKTINALRCSVLTEPPRAER